MADPINAYEMSDDDFLKLGASAFASKASDTDTTDKSVTTDNQDTQTDATDDSDTSATDTTDSASDTDDAQSDQIDQTDDAAAASDASQDDLDDKKTDQDKAADDKTDSKPSDGLDYAAIGKQVMAEFKANGTVMKVKSVEDAIQLMQMGANYHKKMAGLKPAMKTLKLLENHGLLDETKLNYLIDLSQKKPEAITQLLKDSQIDPVTLDLNTDHQYVPQTRTVSDKDLLLDEVLDSISESPAYQKTLTVLGDEWDQESRAAIVQNPAVIRAINTHIENGIYDQVVQAVAYERSMGKLVGISDFDAYQQIGSYMHENNLFVNPATGKPNPADTRQSAKSNTPAKTESDQQLQERLQRKQAASPSRQQKTVVKDTNSYNPLEMSDEEFIKINKLRI